MKDDLSKLLLDWYGKSGRDLPWRMKGKGVPDPYVILVSEMMLQQTTVKTVIPFFGRFMERFPTVQALAAAPLEEVYFYWQGLGYYSRARSLQDTAKIIVGDYCGIFPQTRSEVLKLKGIGTYTSASFLALAFNLPETVIDGNVIRVICRLYYLTEPTKKIMEDIREKAEALTDQKNPADYASAIMDLGALVCTPKNPQCLICPWQKFCLSCGKQDLEQIPCRSKLEKKVKHGQVFLIFNASGEIFIRKRTEKGLLSGLYEFPWQENNQKDYYFDNVEDSGKDVVHVFTHFKLTLRLYIGIAKNVAAEGAFVAVDQLAEYPISTLMKKVWSQAEKILAEKQMEFC